MQVMADEQTVASGKLTNEERVKWMAAGDRFVKGHKRRHWKAVFGEPKAQS
jgi:hypothetical protein